MARLHVILVGIVGARFKGSDLVASLPELALVDLEGRLQLGQPHVVFVHGVRYRGSLSIFEGFLLAWRFVVHVVHPAVPSSDITLINLGNTKIV